MPVVFHVLVGGTLFETSLCGRTDARSIFPSQLGMLNQPVRLGSGPTAAPIQATSQGITRRVGDASGARPFGVLALLHEQVTLMA